MGKHLSLDDRIEIQVGLKNGLSFTEIAARIGKSRTTVGREVLAHRKLDSSTKGNDCIYRFSCNPRIICKDLCSGRNPKLCTTSCTVCNNICKQYKTEACSLYSKPPYVCSSCEKRRGCRRPKMVYEAKHAHTLYLDTLSDARKGISISEPELTYLDEVFSPSIRRGLSVPAIWDQHKDEMPVSVKTVYSYIDCGLLTAGNIDLRLKLRRPLRKKSGPELRVDHACHLGRTYEDFQKFKLLNPDISIVQMDSVIGRPGGKVLLTLFFSNCDLQLMFLRDRNTAASVTAIFSSLRASLGPHKFKELFPAILTDRGSEFTDPSSIESDHVSGELFTRVFYCNPRNSNQKSNCERNHELIRYVLPKGVSFDQLTSEQIVLLMNHINSYPRRKWNNRRPIDLFVEIYGKETAELLGLKAIPFLTINLTPSLLSH